MVVLPVFPTPDDTDSEAAELSLECFRYILCCSLTFIPTSVEVKRSSLSGGGEGKEWTRGARAC
jgi:hypothetical protein